MELAAYPLRVEEVTEREMQEDGFKELGGVENAGGSCGHDGLYSASVRVTCALREGNERL